jgi:hypothetical protein
VRLRYLYVGTSDTSRDVAAWLALPGATLRWRFRHFGADVAAIDLGEPPAVLLADHRPDGSVLPIFAVDDLHAAVEALRDAWTVEAQALGTPDGPVSMLHDASGTEIALLQVDRPEAMDSAYANHDNTHRVVPGS